MSLAVKNLTCQVDYVLVDGTFPITTDIPQKTVKKGDALSVLIGAASIVAKVTRDGIMKGYHQKYPCYNFARNMGYGTREHLNAIRQFGYSPIHRKTFRGVVKGTLNLFQAPCDE
jgi:ribonuclease HII